MDTSKIPSQLRADYASFADNCSKCHNLSRALNAPVTDTRHWDLYVARMMRTAGSSISAAEAPGILRFLYWYTESGQGRGGNDASSYEEPAALLEAPANGQLTPEPAPAPVDESSEVLP